MVYETFSLMYENYAVKVSKPLCVKTKKTVKIVFKV